MAKVKKIWTTTAYRWGERENHSYLLGVFSKKHAAIKCADSHTEYRGGKYGCVVDEFELDNFDNTSNDYSKEIYRTQSVMCKK